ncbi:hypothetical protein [Vulcanococcus sp.]|uniref:hypothetical protein n=1 Tax=Vulcanococcus sp. TaxID=2856995 RepID=UPI003F6A38B2
MGIVSQLRSDGKIVFYDKSIEGFKDADGEDGIFFIVSVPFPNFLYIHAASIFDGMKAAEDLVFLERLSEFMSHSLVGSYELNDDGSRISWSAGIYHNQNKDDLRENILGVISNFMTHVRSVHDGATSSPTEDDAFLDRSSLEDSFRGEPSTNCHPLEIISQSQGETNKEKTITCEIELSDNLHSSVRQEVESRIEDIRKYLVKNEFSLPSEYSLRIQHGNDEKNIESGFNKGPYLCIVDSDGNEKKNMKLFMSRRGNLNSFIAVSTILSRL